MHRLCRAVLYLPACHGEYPQDRQETCGPSEGLSQPQHLCHAASANNNSACGYKQGKDTSERNTEPLQTHQEFCSSPSSLSQWLFFSHYFPVYPRLRASCNLQSQLINVLFSVWSFGSSVRFPKPSHPKVTAGLGDHPGSVIALS